MFLTSFSSPFISVLLAVVLPWLIIILGKNGVEQINPEANEIILISETKVEQEGFHKAYYYSNQNQKKVEEQTCFSQPKTNRHISLIEIPGYGHPDNDEKYDFGVFNTAGSRAPPLMISTYLNI